MKRISKTVFAVLLMFCVATLITMAISSRQQAQKQSQENLKGRKTREPRVADVFELAPEPVDGEEQARRKAKNKRYEKGHPDAKRLADLPPNTGAGRVEHTSDVPPLPAALSDSVVLGTVTKVQPYLTEAETSIYSEFTITVEEVFKNDDKGSLYVGKTIVADREGGALRLPDNRVLRYEVSGIGKLPRLGDKYVFFLKRVNQGQDVSILSGYELRGGNVFSLKGHSPFEGSDVMAFLDEVRRAVSSPRPAASGGGGSQ